MDGSESGLHAGVKRLSTRPFAEIAEVRSAGLGLGAARLVDPGATPVAASTAEQIGYERRWVPGRL